MKYLLLALPLLITAACESTPRYVVAGEDKTVDVLGRQWTVTQVSVDPPYFRAVRDQTQFFMFGPPARTKTSQAITALQTATGCKVIRSTLYHNVSDHFLSQMDCTANPDAVNTSRVWTSKPVY